MNTRRRVVRKWLEDEPSISEDEDFGLMNLGGKDFTFIERGSLGIVCVGWIVTCPLDSSKVTSLDNLLGKILEIHSGGY